MGEFVKRLLVFVFAIMPLLAFATDEICPAGYQPAEYIELEYIESTGTQWINTGYVPNDLTDIELKVNTKGSTSTNYFYGVTGTPEYVVGQQSAGNLLFLDLQTPGHRRVSDITTSNVPHIIQVIDKEFIIDGVSYGVSLGSANGNKTSAFLFRSGYKNVRIYYCKVFEQKRFIQDFIPVRRVFDGAIGMYDRVENKLYGNNGTGEFIAGPETGESFIVNENNVGCVPCSGNTYKPNAGNESCTKCPTGTFSSIGSTQLSDCAKILRVKDYVVYMPLGKRTEHGLCVMVDGKKYCADVYERQ